MGTIVAPIFVGVPVVDDEGAEAKGDEMEEGVGAVVDPKGVGDRVVGDEPDPPVVGAVVEEDVPDPPVVGVRVVGEEPDPPVVGNVVIEDEPDPTAVGDLVVTDEGVGAPGIVAGGAGMDAEGDELGVVAGAEVTDVLGAEPENVIFLTVFCSKSQKMTLPARSKPIPPGVFNVAVVARSPSP